MLNSHYDNHGGSLKIVHSKRIKFRKGVHKFLNKNVYLSEYKQADGPCWENIREFVKHDGE